MTRQRGPWCPACGKEYRSKEGAPEPITGLCSYCGVAAEPVAKKPFFELSKSQIEKFALCEARWYFQYIEHKREPPSKWSTFGIVGHSMAENWIKHGRLPVVNSLDPKSVETKAATSLLGGIPHAPPPTLSGIEAEAEFHYEFSGVHFMGYKDIWAPLPNGAALLGDWKFVGDVDGEHNLTSETIKDDLQATISAYDDVRKGAAGVWLNWVYMPRGARGAKPVRAYIDSAHVVDRMTRIAEAGRRIVSLLQSPPPNARAMKTNPAACGAFGTTCPHISYCHVSKEDYLNQLGDIMSNPLPFTPSPFPTAPTPNGHGPTGGLDALISQMGVQAPQPIVTGQVVQLTAPASAPVQWAPTAITPPLPPPPAPVYEPNTKYRVMYQGQTYEVPGSQVPAVLGAGGQVLDQPAAPAPAPVAAAAPPVAAPPAPAAEPAKRGRPRKADAAPAPAPAPATTQTTVPNPEEPINIFLRAVRDAIDNYLGREIT